MKKRMDRNSLEARARRFEKLESRSQEIYILLRKYGPMTVRGVLKIMFPGSDNLNLVAPRITDLETKGWLVKHKRVHALATGLPVWQWKIAPPKVEQLEFQGLLK